MSYTPHSKEHEDFRLRLNSTNAVYEYMAYLSKKKQEHFYLLNLDSGMKLITRKLLFKGTVNIVNVHLRDIFREVFLANASAFILVHNHPSGILDPSDEDMDLTKRVKKCAELLQVGFVDHIIIGNGFKSLIKLINRRRQ